MSTHGHNDGRDSPATPQAPLRSPFNDSAAAISDSLLPAGAAAGRPQSYAGSNPFSPPGTPATRQSYGENSVNSPPASYPMLAAEEPRPVWSEKGTDQPRGHRRRNWILIALAALVVVVLAVVLPIYFVVIRKNGDTASGGKGSSGGSHTNPESPTGAITGGDGTKVVMADGTTFTYKNPFGGYWVSDPANPFDNSARPQSWSPALNETWDYTQHRIRGVNLGGWLVPEPFIAPALYEKYQGSKPSEALPGGLVVDEWSLSVAMLNDTSDSGGIKQMEDHYRTFITEEDFAKIAGAGLNWIRLPIPYWAIETRPGEPFLAKKSWDYTLLALKWARKYGLRVYLEMHTAPGSQNGYNHSGRLGPVNFLNGYMGIANAQRTMDYIRVITEFISQKEYQDVVQMFGIINEPLLGIIGRDQLSRFYLQAHNMIREITGIGKDPYIVIHEGFQATSSWKDFLPGSDRIVLDTHPYVAFGGDFDHPLDHWPSVGCQAYNTNQSNIDFGVTVAGEFSGAINDCGKWVRNVGSEPSSTECGTWDDYENWTDDMKTGVKNFVLSQMDGMRQAGYFYWTWKVGNSSVTGKVSAPLWSYSLGLEHGYMPADPREADGFCAGLNFAQNVPFSTYSAWQTGGAGAGTIAPDALASFSEYPPPVISNAEGIPPAQLPTFTATSAMPTLPPATFSGAAAASKGGNGWANPQDTAQAAVEVSGCTYPNAWGPPPTMTQTVCGAASAPTPPPTR